MLSRLVYRSSAVAIPSPDSQTEAVAYRSSSAILKFEIPLPQSASRGEVSGTTSLDLEDSFDSTMELLHSERNTTTVSHPSRMNPSFSSAGQSGSSPADPVRLWKGVETVVNLILPDRYAYTIFPSWLPLVLTMNSL